MTMLEATRAPDSDARGSCLACSRAHDRD